MLLRNGVALLLKRFFYIIQDKEETIDGQTILGDKYGLEKNKLN